MFHMFWSCVSLTSVSTLNHNLGWNIAQQLFTQSQKNKQTNNLTDLHTPTHIFPPLPLVVLVTTECKHEKNNYIINGVRFVPRPILSRPVPPQNQPANPDQNLMSVCLISGPWVGSVWVRTRCAVIGPFTLFSVPLSSSFLFNGAIIRSSGRRDSPTATKPVSTTLNNEKQI